MAAARPVVKPTKIIRLTAAWRIERTAPQGMTLSFRKGFLKLADFVDNPAVRVVRPNLDCRDGK